MNKFKIGQTITPKQYMQGFEKVTIFDIDSDWYHVKIMNGVATIPIHIVESNYELYQEKPKRKK